jgi:hypothetical protein
MPNFWVGTTMSPPVKRRDDIKKIVEEYGGKLRENELYSELEKGKAYVLIKGPSDSVKAKAMLDRIGATEVIVVLDLDESTQAYALTRQKKPPAKRSTPRRPKS